MLLLLGGTPVVALWWVWLLAFDGPHIGAAFTRTYLDRAEWRTRPGGLLRGLLVFAVGPAFLAAGLVTGSERPFALFLGVAALYGYYHVVRQHYGFLALYQADSLDFVDLVFAIEKRFGVTLRDDELDVLSQLDFSSPEVMRDGFLTRDVVERLTPALLALRAVDDPGRVTPAAAFGLITVGTLCAMVARKQGRPV